MTDARREFIARLSGVALAWPLAARAASDLPVIGYLGAQAPQPPSTPARSLAAFRQGLGEIGFVEGRNVVIEYRSADGQNDRLPALATDLVRRQVAVIVALASTSAALAAKSATQTIPIVFLVGTDPVKAGLVASLNRPGGNLTGVTNLTIQVAAKRLELLHELVPASTSIALLVNPTNRLNAEAQTTESQFAARALGVHLLVLNASSPTEIQGAFATLVRERAAALAVSGDAFFNAQRDQIIALAARHAVPTIEQFREFPVGGGLMSYGPDAPDAWRLAGVYTGRVLKGEKPADLPVQQATRVEMVVNLKAAKALGLTIPESLLATADEVIQ
jgi:putative tryptophan/tyrosine transport system substrate-binding protein